MPIILSIIIAAVIVGLFLLFLAKLRRDIIRMLENPFEGIGELGIVDLGDEEEKQ